MRLNVASNPEAIGFVASALVDSSVKAIDKSIMMSKPIVLLTVGAPSEKVQKLIDFIKAEGK